LRGWTLLAVALLVLQAALGGAAGAGAAAGRCSAVPSCQLHALLAPATVALLLALAIAGWRRGRPASGAAVGLLALVQGGLGVAQIAGPLPLALGLAHNVAGALLLAATVGLLPAR
jgi:heme A synthase